MTRYLLVENRTIVHLCTHWKPRYITNELEDNDINFTVPDAESYIKINDNFELIPIVESIVPSYNSIYEHLCGPYYIYDIESVSESYTKDFNDIGNIKNALKDVAASIRYTKENSGCMVDVQGVQVFLDTVRDNRNVFIQKYSMMGDTDIVNWKFPDRWLSLSKTDLGGIIYQGMIFIQSQFDWEKNLSDQIDLASTIEELQIIMEEN